MQAIGRMGISGTTAKLCSRNFVPLSHPGPFAVVASSRKRQTKVGTLACFDFLTMLFHVDMNYLAKQANAMLKKVLL